MVKKRKEGKREDVKEKAQPSQHNVDGEKQALLAAGKEHSFPLRWNRRRRKKKGICILSAGA